MRGSVDTTGVPPATQGAPWNSLTKIASAVRVARAWQVSVGLGPPSALARAELSAMYRPSTKRDLALPSSTESASDVPIRMVDWTCRMSGAQSSRTTLLGDAVDRLHVVVGDH